jgi:hypothetical protein
MLLNVVIVVWLGVLTIWVFLFFLPYRKLTKVTGEKELNKVLERVIEQGSANKKDIASVLGELRRFEKDGLNHLQRVGFVRFNPFTETGGDNSFALCILDANLNGILIMGLHTRESTRLYTKEVVSGKTTYKLSKEEQLALKRAINE